MVMLKGMPATAHRFLWWFPLWAVTTGLAFVGLSIAAAQVWPGAKRWDESQRDKVLAAMSEPSFWLLAVMVVAIWAYATWHTRPTRKSRYAGWDQRSIEGLSRISSGSSSIDRANRLAAMHSLMPEPAKGCPEMPIWKAAEYVQQAIGDGDFQHGYPEARRKIRQAALEGALEIWGRREIPPAHLTDPQGASTVWTKIEPDYWQAHELTFVAISEDDDDQAHTWTEGNKLKIGDRYWSLRVRRAQVENLWREPKTSEPKAPNEVSQPAVLAVGVGPDTAPETKIVSLELTNTGGSDATGIIARLTNAQPALAEGRPDPIGLPLVLTTKARLDRHRTNVQPLPQRPFNVQRGDKTILPIFKAPRFNPTFGTIISEAGEIQVIFQEYVLTVEVIGVDGEPFSTVITIKHGVSGSWNANIAIKSTGKA